MQAGEALAAEARSARSRKSLPAPTDLKMLAARSVALGSTAGLDFFILWGLSC